MGTGSFPGVKSGRGVTLTPHPLLVPWSRKSRAIPLLPLWAVRPVQSLSACTRVHFTLPPSLLYNGYRDFPGVKSGRGVTLTPHPLLVPWSRKGRAIPLLAIWAVRRVELYLYLPYGPYGLYGASVPVQGCTLPYFTFLT